MNFIKKYIDKRIDIALENIGYKKHEPLYFCGGEYYTNERLYKIEENINRLEKYLKIKYTTTTKEGYKKVKSNKSK